MAKNESCPFHCPPAMLWLFAALGVWFVLQPFGAPAYGGFWSWVVVLSGACAWVCARNAGHRKSACPFACTPVWVGVVTTAVGVWYVLGDTGAVSTYSIPLLPLVTLIGAAFLISTQKKCH